MTTRNLTLEQLQEEELMQQEQEDQDFIDELDAEIDDDGMSLAEAGYWIGARDA